MELTYGMINQIVNQSNAVKFEEWDIPMGLSINITQRIIKLTDELRAFEKERTRLFKKHAQMDETTGNVKVDEKGNVVFADENARKAFNDDFMDLLEEPITVPFKPLKIDFDDPDINRVIKKPKEISFLIPLLEVEE